MHAAARLPRMLALSCLLAVAACQGGNNGANYNDGESVDGSQDQIVDSLILAAQASEASGDWIAATQYWGSLLQRDPTNARYARGLGESLRRTANYGDAVQVLRQGVNQNPESAALVAELGKALLAAGQRDEAIATLNQAAAMDGSDWTVQSALAVAYGMTGKPDLADQHYRQALALSPDNPVVLNNYALHLAINGRLGDGLAMMEQATRLNGATSKMRENLALLLAVNGDIVRAEEIVRAELPRDSADRQMAFLRTLTPSDLVNLSGLVENSELVIDSTALAPPAGGSNVVDLTNTGADDSSFLEDQPGVVVVEEEVYVAPPAGASGDGADLTLAQQSAALSASLADALEGNGAAQEAPAAVVAEPVPEPVALPAAAPPPPPPLEEAVAVTMAPAPEPLPEPAPVAVTAPAAEPVVETVVEEMPQAAPDVAAPDVAAAETVAEVVAGPAWRVQLASLASADAAETGRNRALAAHPGLLEAQPVDVVSAVLDNGNTTWRVLAGRYADKSGAIALCEAIRAEGGDCFVMKDNAGG